MIRKNRHPTLTRFSMKKRHIIQATTLLFFCAINGSFAQDNPTKIPQEKTEEEDEEADESKKKDDWVLKLNIHQEPSMKAPTVGAGRSGPFGGGAGMRLRKSVSAPRPSAAPMSASLGFSTGGAKDINNFRANIENKFLPLPEDITVEGLYYDYFFDTGATAPCEKLFCPVYNLATSPDPLSGNPDYYMAVGLTSDLKAEDFGRKKLNLVIVLDISGSMNSPFNQYHYDRKRPRILPTAEKEEKDNRTKMAIANEAVQQLTRHLRDNDRFGMVVFDNQGYLAKPLNPVGETDMDKIREHIGELRSRGGTNFEAGYKEGTKLFGELKAIDANEYENRIIFLTDAMPNRGQIEEGRSLWPYGEKRSAQNLQHLCRDRGRLQFHPDRSDHQSPGSQLFFGSIQ